MLARPTTRGSLLGGALREDEEAAVALTAAGWEVFMVLLVSGRNGLLVFMLILVSKKLHYVFPIWRNLREKTLKRLGFPLVECEIMP
ncbi:hypothetical protein BTL55_11045 [Bordetella trematum]|nr:hypothetical protein BTL55_11045 [Bordetella trematum]